MRIALVHMRHAHSGGTERYLNLVSAHLASVGHEVTIVCRSHEAPTHEAIRFEVLRPLSFTGAGRMWNFAKAVEAHVSGAHYDLVFGLGKTWTHDVIRMGGGCHATYLELAHDATLTPLERLLHKGARKHKLALEIESRALAAHASRKSGARPLVITNSGLVKRDVIARHGVDPDGIQVVYNGTDTERFHPRLRVGKGAELRSDLGWNADHQVLLFLGTGYGRKGLDLVLQAAARLAPSNDALRLMVVGYDSSAAAFKARAAELGIADRCQFLGGRRDAEICFGAADVYALPTRYDPFANSTIEAMASGLPTITTQTNGGSELIEEGVSGSVLSEKPTPEELAERVGHWFDQRASGGHAARLVAERHDAKLMAQRTQSILEALATSQV
ncbi:MAG: UDP-glucose:(heptosyl)LPS alpha-1,3-glucosyltransferase [Planctomycetota bacterium]|jgi:UDP-glucose:(heptosyl)LPS alpha-1,3-glucosyltransferase